MATNAEFMEFVKDSGLQDRMPYAIVLAAEGIRTEDVGTANHVVRLVWAGQALRNPESMVKAMLWAVLARNPAATLAQIKDATDDTLNTQVAEAVVMFVGS